MTNTRQLKSRNQREGWYAGSSKQMRASEKAFSLRVRTKRKQAFWYLNDMLRISHE